MSAPGWSRSHRLAVVVLFFAAAGPRPSRDDRAGT